MVDIFYFIVDIFNVHEVKLMTFADDVLHNPSRRDCENFSIIGCDNKLISLELLEILNI